MNFSNGLMRKTAITIVFSFFLVSLYAFIFSMSDQDAEKSSSISRMISEKCVELFNQYTARNWSEELRLYLAAYFEHPIRKLAHFSEYACMGVLLFGIWIQWMKKGWKFFAMITVWVFISAALDEFHQLFISGRYASFLDVLLDTSGCIFALFICNCVCKIHDRRLKKKMIKGSK